MEDRELVEIIRRAVQTERDGNRYYGRAAEVTPDPNAKKMFAQLARDELYHVQVIEELYRDLLPQGSGDTVKGFSIFEEKEKQWEEERQSFNNEHEVLERAILDEIESRDFYRSHAESFESAQAKEVFLDLMEMEEGHIRLLRAELDHLVRTGFYFDHMEFSVEGERD